MIAPRDTAGVEFVPWGELRAAFDWRQGEHVTLVGPTGCGKSTLARGILSMRSYVVALGTKPRDRTLDGLRREGYRVSRHWPPPWPPEFAPRVLLWPKIDSVNDLPAQRETIRQAIEAIYRAGGWCVFADEGEYVANPDYLGLGPQMRMLWQQGRALDVSVVLACQRPRHVPLAAYSQATHLFLWRSSDRRDLDRLAELNGADTGTLKRLLPRLPKHEALYVNTRDGELFRTRFAP